MADDSELAEIKKKNTEFRDRNVVLIKETADQKVEIGQLKAQIDELKLRYDGIDPAAVAADRARLAGVTALETELAAEKTAHADTRKRADSVVIENKIGDAFSRAGGRPQARAFIVAQAAGLFTVENGEVKGTKHSPDRPGEAMNLDEWLTLQFKENSYVFFPSGGSGADPRPSGGATGKVLRNPSPQDLGRHAKEIASGELKVSYE